MCCCLLKILWTKSPRFSSKITCIYTLINTPKLLQNKNAHQEKLPQIASIIVISKTLHLQLLLLLLLLLLLFLFFSSSFYQLDKKSCCLGSLMSGRLLANLLLLPKHRATKSCWRTCQCFVFVQNEGSLSTVYQAIDSEYISQSGWKIRDSMLAGFY